MSRRRYDKQSEAPAARRPSHHPAAALPAAPPISRARLIWMSVALVAMSAAIYAPVQSFGFVTYDDPAYVSENRAVLGGVTWRGIEWAFTTAHASNWHPVTWLSHMLDVQLYGAAAGPHHVTNLILHVLNTLLLFGLLVYTTRSSWRSLFVAAAFAVHPLHVESVAWIAERKDVLSTCFEMLALWAYVAYVRKPHWGRYFLVAGFLALGLMSKPMLVTLPCVLLLFDVWPLGRVSLTPARDGDRRPRPPYGWTAWAPLVREKIALFALAIASMVVTFIAQRRGGAVSALDVLPLRARMANAVVSYLLHREDVLACQSLGVLSVRLSIPAWQVALSILVLMTVTMASVRLARRAPYLIVGWLWFVGTLVPVIGLVQVGSQATADRYTYVPLIGLFIIAAWGVADLTARWPARRSVLVSTAMIVVTVLGVTARTQVQYWRSGVDLWEHALLINPSDYRAHLNLGAALVREKRYSQALLHFSEAIRVEPEYAEAYNNLGLALAGQGDAAAAVAQYQQAVQINPDYIGAHNNLGNALSDAGDPDSAIREYENALRLDPEYAIAHDNLAIAFAGRGEIDSAIHEFSEAVRIDPEHAEWHYEFAVMLRDKGDAPHAIEQASVALAINPNHEAAAKLLADLTKR